MTPFYKEGATLGTGIPTGVAPSPSSILLITRVGPRILSPSKSSTDLINLSFVCNFLVLVLVQLKFYNL